MISLTFLLSHIDFPNPLRAQTLAYGKPQALLSSSSIEKTFLEWLFFSLSMKWRNTAIFCQVRNEIFLSSIRKGSKTSQPFHSSWLLVVYFQGLWIHPSLSILRSYIVLVFLLQWGRDKVQVEALQALLCCLCRLLLRGFVAKCHFCSKVLRG